MPYRSRHKHKYKRKLTNENCVKTTHYLLACTTTSTRPKQLLTSPAMAAKKTTESAPAGHIVFFPFLAQGHIIPFLALARLIEHRHPSLAITLLTTPLNLHRLLPSLPPSSSIRLCSLPFSSSTDNTDSLPTSHILQLCHASLSLRPAFQRFLSSLADDQPSTPICVVADVFFGWTAEVASSLGVRHVTFTTCGGYGTAAYFSLWVNLPHASTNGDEFSIPGFPDTARISRSQLSSSLRAADGSDRWSTFLSNQIRLSTNTGAMLCNTVEEIERTGLEILRKMVKSPVLAIGPLLPSYFLHREQAPPSSSQQPIRPHKELGIAVHDCMQWLNLHPPSSVLFVSFGSQNTIAAAQMMELAKGLESSGHPFIWVIRPPFGNDVNVDIRHEWLPPGFEERMNEKKQGLLVRRWAPQLEILSHSSTGAFLSHCGWNSTLESLSQGVAIMGWPLAAEQFYNSKMMEEEMGVSVEVGRGAADQEVKGEKVERVVRMVMGETSEKGREMREKAERVGEMIRASMVDEDGKVGSSLRALDEFIRTTLGE